MNKYKIIKNSTPGFQELEMNEAYEQGYRLVKFKIRVISGMTIYNALMEIPDGKNSL